MKTQTTNRSPAALRRTASLVLSLAVIGLLAGCDDATGPGSGARSVSLSFGLAGGTAAPAPGLFAAALDYSDGMGNQLVIDGAEIVLREIEFKRVGVLDCPVEPGDDSCEEFKTGPFRVALPLDGTVSTELEATVDEGTYDRIDFDVHKLDESDPADAALLGLYPNLTDISIRVTGQYNAQPFTYTSDLNEEQKVELVEPLVIAPETGSINVTLILDMSSWFKSSSDVLLDPSTANKGEPNEDWVRDAIRTSIEGFRDDDHDGIPHSDDLDEDDS